MTIETLIASAYRYALSLCAQKPLAEDLVQEAWLRVVERYGHDVDRAVLFRAVRNLYIDRWRHETRFPTESCDEFAASAVDPVGYDHDPLLARALSTLGDVERETLFLAVIEGYTAAEIAHLMDCPRGSVLSRLHRAKQKLADRLEAQAAEMREECAVVALTQPGQSRVR